MTADEIRAKFQPEDGPGIGYKLPLLQLHLLAEGVAQLAELNALLRTWDDGTSSLGVTRMD